MPHRSSAFWWERDRFFALLAARAAVDALCIMRHGQVSQTRARLRAQVAWRARARAQRAAHARAPHAAPYAYTHLPTRRHHQQKNLPTTTTHLLLYTIPATSCLFSWDRIWWRTRRTYYSRYSNHYPTPCVCCHSPPYLLSSTTYTYLFSPSFLPIYTIPYALLPLPFLAFAPFPCFLCTAAFGMCLYFLLLCFVLPLCPLPLGFGQEVLGHWLDGMAWRAWACDRQAQTRTGQTGQDRKDRGLFCWLDRKDRDWRNRHCWAFSCPLLPTPSLVGYLLCGWLHLSASCLHILSLNFLSVWHFSKFPHSC